MWERGKGFRFCNWWSEQDSLTRCSLSGNLEERRQLRPGGGRSRPEQHEGVDCVRHCRGAGGARHHVATEKAGDLAGRAWEATTQAVARNSLAGQWLGLRALTAGARV